MKMIRFNLSTTFHWFEYTRRDVFDTISTVERQNSTFGKSEEGMWGGGGGEWRKGRETKGKELLQDIPSLTCTASAHFPTNMLTSRYNITISMCTFSLYTLFFLPRHKYRQKSSPLLQLELHSIIKGFYKHVKSISWNFFLFCFQPKNTPTKKQ